MVLAIAHKDGRVVGGRKGKKKAQRRDDGGHDS